MTTRALPRADPSRALQALHRGESVFPGYAVCKRTGYKSAWGSVFKVVKERMTWRQAVDACDPLPADHLVCLMASYR